MSECIECNAPATNDLFGVPFCDDCRRITPLVDAQMPSFVPATRRLMNEQPWDTHDDDDVEAA